MNEVLESRQTSQIAPVPGAEDDGPSLDRLEALLQSWLMGRVRNLRLFWRDGGLELHGEAHSYYAKQLAQHAVMKTTPWPIVANAIVVL